MTDEFPSELRATSVGEGLHGYPSKAEPTAEMVATLREALELCGYGVGAGAARAALTAALLVQVEQSESLGVITADEYAKAQRDPEVILLQERAKRIVAEHKDAQ